jgi:hypothetical protein
MAVLERKNPQGSSQFQIEKAPKIQTLKDPQNRITDPISEQKINKNKSRHRN